MARRAITRELYDALVIGYRESPGNASHAARMAGVDRRTAQRGYAKGWTRYMSWARPIEQVLAQERADARARAAELEKAREAEQEGRREKARAESVEAQAQEQQILKVARADVLGALALAAELTPAMRALAKKVALALEAEGSKLSAKEALLLLNRHATLMAKGVQAAELIVKLGRLDRGESTENLRFEAELGLEEAAEQIDAAEAALGRARAKGLLPARLELLEGGLGKAEG